MKIISVDTSPIEPGILPRKASIQLTGTPVATFTSASTAAAGPLGERRGAGETVRRAVHARSPEILRRIGEEIGTRAAPAG